MTASEEFKQAIRAGNISEAFIVAMSNAPELKITTKIVTADGNKIDADAGVEDNYLHTHINLIEGKVENEIGEKLTGDRYSEIKQFHIQQVTESHQTIQHNLISLQKMFQLMSSFQEEQIANQANWVDIATDASHKSISAPQSREPLAGNASNALTPSIESEGTSINSSDRDSAEPQLPSFDESDDEIVNDLLSLADIDESETETNPDSDQTSENQADWSEWLDDEPDVETKVFDLKSLNIEDARKNWQDWEEQNEAVDTDLKDEE